MRSIPGLFAVAVALASSLLAASSAWAASRGIDVELRQSERAGAPVAATVRLYGASHALVIGIDNYTGGWPRLANAVKDAELVAAELVRRGFEVRLETDLDAAALRNSLRSFFAIKGIDPEARLLLWYAGHGETLDGEGFLVPADAPVSSDPLFKVKALHMRDFGGLVRLAASKHVLSVFDSCFSGTIFAARAGSPLAAITRKTAKPVRQFVTSGDSGQLVSDDGSFRTLFLRALRGEAGADFNDDGYLTGDELGLYLSQEVSALTAAAQTPVYGKLQDVRYNQGDFVFALAGGAGRATAKTTAPSPGAGATYDREALLWDSIKDSDHPADYCAFLESFPDGPFAPVARLRCERQTALAAPLEPKVEIDPVSAGKAASAEQQLKLTAGLAAAAFTRAASAGTLGDVRARGVLRCVVSTGIAGFAYPDANGVWRGFDIDFCRATAAAVLGDPNKIMAVTSTGRTRFTLLNAGEGDVLWRNTTVTFSRDVGVKLRFQGVNYYDGQGFMVKKSLGVKRATELDGASVCIQTGTTTELNLADFFHANNMKYEAVPVETNDEARQNYLAGRCDVYTTDASGLAATRSTFTDPDNHIILPEIISKEPLGPATRHGDDQWSDIITWVLNATITAEEKGVTQANVDRMKGSKDPEILRLLGVEGNQGKALGLDNRWAYWIIKSVGNYGEIFERNIGVNTPLGLERGMNALWTNGGLQYSPPFR